MTACAANSRSSTSALTSRCTSAMTHSRSGHSGGALHSSAIGCAAPVAASPMQKKTTANPRAITRAYHGTQSRRNERGLIGTWPGQRAQKCGQVRALALAQTERLDLARPRITAGAIAAAIEEVDDL